MHIFLRALTSYMRHWSAVAPSSLPACKIALLRCIKKSLGAICFILGLEAFYNAVFSGTPMPSNNPVNITRFSSSTYGT